MTDLLEYYLSLIAPVGHWMECKLFYYIGMAGRTGEILEYKVRFSALHQKLTEGVRQGQSGL
jgi:hypothetical protein